MRIEIKLEGYNGFGYLVCDTCPCCWSNGQGCGCGLGYWKRENYENGVININTGEVLIGEHREKRVADGWYGASIRPQKCIDKHGR